MRPLKSPHRVDSLSTANYNFSSENRHLEELAPNGGLLYSVYL